MYVSFGRIAIMTRTLFNLVFDSSHLAGALRGIPAPILPDAAAAGPFTTTAAHLQTPVTNFYGVPVFPPPHFPVPWSFIRIDHLAPFSSAVSSAPSARAVARQSLRRRQRRRRRRRRLRLLQRRFVRRPSSRSFQRTKHLYGLYIRRGLL